MLLLACPVAVYILHKARRGTPFAEEAAGFGELILELGLGFLFGVFSTLWLKEHAPNAVSWSGNVLCTGIRWLALYIFHLVKAAWRGTAEQEAEEQMHQLFWKLAGWLKNAVYSVADTAYGILYSGAPDDALVVLNTTSVEDAPTHCMPNPLSIPNDGVAPVLEDILQSVWTNAPAALNDSDVAAIQDDVHPSEPWQLSDVVFPAAFCLLLGMVFLLFCERARSFLLRWTTPMKCAVHKVEREGEEEPALPQPTSAGAMPYESVRFVLLHQVVPQSATTSPSTSSPSSPNSGSTPASPILASVPAPPADVNLDDNAVESTAPSIPVSTSFPASPVFASPEIGYASTPRLRPLSPPPPRPCPSPKSQSTSGPASQFSPKLRAVPPRTAQIARRLLQLGVAAVASDAEVRVLQKWARAGSNTVSGSSSGGSHAAAAEGSDSCRAVEGSGARGDAEDVGGGSVGDGGDGEQTAVEAVHAGAEAHGNSGTASVLQDQGTEKMRMWRGSRWG
ncbi:hypothetical protein B0H16DRAFT_1735397 [Mycena metata]|uniref:Uncharacterized protein n=1 Tax=Mycena metata TaxID=1033252 RepID=A0AAD7MPH2_9AGAR|nr:hypothetical protein B0H16DRAFT_1735397 [Mycena metata]